MFRGEGVLKSTDGGDSWTPFWQGMDYLRVQKVAVSPDFASDRRVAAQVVYNEIEPWQDGVAVYASDDAGLAWSRAITAESASDAAYVAAWAATAKLPEAPVRLDMYTGLEVTQDGGLTWRGIDLGLADADYLSEVAIAPDYPDDAAIYVRSRLALFRTNDGGQTWTRWDDPRLAGRDYANDLSALAVGRGATGHIVFLGTTNGELWRIPGADLTMTPVTMTVLAEPAPTPMPVAAATPIPAATPVLATPEPLAAEPPAGVYRPTGPLATWWEADADLQARLGWATTADPFPVAMAQQSFATGVMLWREDTHAIYVLSDDGHWSVYPDTFTEGEPESDPSLSPPAGYLQPIRGFGKVWRENPDVAERVGWARGREAAATGSIQPFERGVLIGTGLRTFALIEETPESGMWK